MTRRCNCDASCGENRYHDVGEAGCRFANDEEYDTYWDLRRHLDYVDPKRNQSKKDMMMAKANKVNDKLTKVNESFTIHMYDNGYMIEVGGKDKKDDWKTAKIMVSTVEELLSLIKEVTEMEKDA